MAEDNDQEKSLPATPRREEQAREEGQVARSRELGTSLVLMAAAAALWWLGPQTADSLGQLLRAGLAFDHASALDTRGVLLRLHGLSWQALLLLLPWLAILVLAACAGGVAMGGWLFSVKAFSADFSRLGLLRGLGNMVSGQALAELGKALLKAILIVCVAVWLLWHDREALMSMGSVAPESALASVARLVVLAFLLLAASTVLVAMLDVPLQLWKHHKGLRMSLDEVKREMRESDGDPQLKARIRSLQREATRRRMMSEVPKADVVVTNPTHYAVALAYREGSRAPQVVAKGHHLLAGKIREVAMEAGVPILEAPPLARALYKHAELGAEIPWQLYEAVALVLAWVMQLRMARAGAPVPRPPQHLPVPPEMSVDEEAS